MRLVIVSGATATGKTYIAKNIADRMKYTLYSKDAIKEELFDKHLRTKHNYFWYEKKAKSIFFDEIKNSISKDISIVVENNFMKNDKRRLSALINKEVQVVEIYCIARGFTRLKRFIKRGESELRHKAHYDRKWYPTVFIGCLLGYIGIKWPYGPLAITSKVLTLDTTDFSKVGMEQIVEFSKKHK